MKTTCNRSSVAHSARAASLPEMMISMVIFGLLIMGLVSVNLFGLRENELVSSKLGANDGSRTAFDLMLNEIRGGKSVQIGTGWHTNFIPITNGPQRGDTIQIYPSTNTAAFIYYFIDTNVYDSNYNCLVRVGITNVALTNTYQT